MKTALITGAGGFIGGAVVREFVAKGWHTTAVVHRHVPDALHRLADQDAVRLRRADLGDKHAVAGLFTAGDGDRPPDVVVHCAGRASDTGWHRAFRRANFDAVRHLAQAVLEHEADRFVFISTTDVYGLRDATGEDENALPLQAYPRNPYPEFKIMAEQWIRDHLSASRYVILRPAQVWGPGDTTLTPRLVSFLRHSPFIVHFGRWRGMNRWPLAHVGNVAGAAFEASVAPTVIGQAINVLDSEHTSIDAWTRLVAEIYLPGKLFRTLHVPLWAGAAIGRPVSLASNLLNLARPLIDPSHYALHAVSANLDFSNARLRRLFADANRPMITREEGLRELRFTP